jgi:type I restriction enzyme S subunit
MRLTPTAMTGSLGITPLSVGDRRAVPPRNWAWRLLTSCARLESGHTPSRYHREWWGGQIPWISLTDIRELDGKIAQETKEYTNEAGIANSAARVLPAGTVVLSRTASVGFVTIMGREMATSQDFVNWVCGPDLDPRFLAYLFRASRAYLRSLSSGAIHQTIYMPTVEAFEVCIPDLTDQKRIVCSLDEQVAAVEQARAAAEAQLEAAKAFPVEWARSVFQHPEQIGARSLSLRDLSNAPDAFPDGPFGSNLKTEHYTSTGARVVRLQNIGRGEFLDADKAYVSFEHFGHLERHHVQSGDVVVAALGDGARPAGRACMVPNNFGPGLVKADCFRVRLPQDVILPEYLVAYLNSPESLRRVSELMRGATRPRVNLEMLRQLVVPVPSLAVQRELLAALHGRSACALMIQAAGEHRLRAIAALPAALLRRAFGGEL